MCEEIQNVTHRIVYMGTPQFACPTLEMLARNPRVDVSLVVTQPDRPAGRGRALQEAPVSALARSLGLPVYQTPSLRTGDQRQPVVDARPDLVVVAAFGLILGKSVLELSGLGCVNLHASLLPQYRGASPIAAAILSRDPESGVTLMQMERGLDTGRMLAARHEPIRANDTTASLTERLADVAAGLLADNLGPLLDGSLTPVPQPAGGTITRPLVKADGWIAWDQPARVVEAHVRAMWSWPRAWTTLADGTTLQIHETAVVDQLLEPEAGAVVVRERQLYVACGTGTLRIDRAQLAGGKPLDGRQLASHPGFGNGTVLGSTGAPQHAGPIVSALPNG